ncbi:MAG: hypothetical protein Q8R38_02550 [Candidatus Omnitrophota bacterium]|nr:hypothetical protein [Candidatus Omnitrophota bacterium]
MFKKITAVFIVCLLGITCISENVFADRRSYVWTYEYQTMPKGMAEIEYYLTEEQKNINKAKPNTWKHWFELEYGITDHWDISMYQQFKQSNTISSSTFEYDGFKVRTRYRFFEKDKLPVDTMLYLEYIRNDNLEKPNVLEGKIIFAKDIANFNIAYNQILKQELAYAGKTEHEYAAGVSYEITPAFKIGIESKGNYTDRKYYVGPTIGWASSKFWVSAGVAAGLNEQSDDMQVRMIMGFLF